MLKKAYSYLLVLIISILISNLYSCSQTKDTKEINLEKSRKAGVEKVLPVASKKGEPIRIAIGSMITPKEGYAYYKQLLDYIEEKSGREVKLVDRSSYAEINALLKSGDIDVAFVCGGPYVEGHDDFGLKLLVVPQAGGKSVYYSYIIVPVDSPVKSFEDLRGKTFAFADPDSNTGKLVPTYMLSRINETPDSFFKKYIFTYAHDKSIKAVAQKLVDGAAVDSLIWEYYNKTRPELTSKTMILKKSPPYGIPPVVVGPDTGPETIKRVREILLNLHRDKKGKAILNGMMLEKFVLSNDAAYESIRQMNVWIDKEKINK